MLTEAQRYICTTKRFIRRPDSDTENHLQNTVLTGWNIGNMTTYTRNSRRVQKNNGAAWNYMRFLQIRKTGDTFYLRASHDGKNRTVLPGSPFIHPGLPGDLLNVGLFQASNNNVRGFGSFRNIRLWVTS